MAAQLTDNQRAWINELRREDLNQTKSVLKRVQPDGTVSFCCLGVASELSGLCVQARNEVTGSDGSSRVSFTPVDRVVTGDIDPGSAMYDTLPPGEVLQWLDIAPEGRMASADIGLDVPQEMRYLREQGTEDQARQYADSRFVTDPRNQLYYLTAAGMNDSGFTFSQIADTFEYFGLASIRGAA